MAIDLAGSTEAIDLPGPVTVTKNRAALTGMAWVRLRTIAASDTKIFGYSTGASSSLSRFTLQWVSATPGQPRVGGRADDAEGQKTLLSATALQTGRWHHVVGIIDYANSLGAIYVDGELDTEGALSGVFAAAQTSNTNTLDARWGGREGTGTQGMDGLIEDCRIYDRILGAAEVLTIFTGRGKDGIKNGLLHHYPLVDFGPGVAMVSAACLADAERIVGQPVGSPSYAEGIIVPRKRWRRGPRKS